VTTEDILFVEKLIREQQPEGKIIYTDKLNSNEIFKIKLRLKSETIQSIGKDTRQNSVVLSRLERKEIARQFDLLCSPFWSDNLFNDSKLVPIENLWPYFKTVYQEYSESLSNPNSSETDRSNLVKNYQRPSVFQFSPPIYLKDKTICLIYVRSLCGNPCGVGELAFYKKENGQWNKWVVVSVDNY
jgi:hypothetical protein